MMTHAEMMAAKDGNAYPWIDGLKRFAKIVHDGRTVSRIDRLTDGTTRTTADGVQTIHASWELALRRVAALVLALRLVGAFGQAGAAPLQTAARDATAAEHGRGLTARAFDVATGR